MLKWLPRTMIPDQRVRLGAAVATALLVAALLTAALTLTSDRPTHSSPVAASAAAGSAAATATTPSAAPEATVPATPAPATTVATTPDPPASVSSTTEPSTVAPADPPAASAPAPAPPPKLAPPAPAPTPAPPAVAAPPTQSWQLTQLQALFNAVIPAGERAALPASWVLAYNDPRESCGVGCTGILDGHLETSFSPGFFNQSASYQRNIMAHEIAHAYGYSHWSLYAYPSWAGQPGWMGQFHLLGRGFAGQYDAEAWASCVAWKQSGFNNRVDQIAAPCTEQAASYALAQL